MPPGSVPGCTATALASAPARYAGTASAINNDVARVGALIAVAVLPAAAGITGAAYLDPGQFSAGFHTASLIAGALCVLGGALAAATIRDPDVAVAQADTAHRLHCSLDAPPTHAAPLPHA